MQSKLKTNQKQFTRNNLLSIFIGAIVTIFAGCANPDYQKMRGVWETKLSNNEIAVIVVEDDNFIIHTASLPNLKDLGKKFKFTLDSSKTPKQFEYKASNEVANANLENEAIRGIIELSDKRMRVAFAKDKNSPVPSSFEEKDTWLFEWKGESVDFAPIDSNYIKGVKTLNYWIALNRINDNNNPGDPFENAKTPDQVIKACNDTIIVLKNIRSGVNKLDVSGVDSEVTSYVSEYLDNLNKAESMLDDMAVVIKDAQELDAIGNSDEALEMALFDLFLGKPGATIDALNAEAQGLKNRMLAIQNKAKQAGEESDKLGTKQLMLRSSLSSKYNREFPQFNN